MAKASKRRHCPALGCEITPADCGDDRNRRVACPADCEFNPFNPTNYDQLLEIEDRLDHKTLDRLAAESADRMAFLREVQAAVEHASGHADHAFMVRRIFFTRDPSGLTCAQRWEKSGYGGLRNDERALFSAKAQMRVAALEIRQVLDERFLEAVDLLAPEKGPMRFLDRSLAARATRFAVIIAWIFPLPHFGRLSGTAIVLPEMGGPTPEEVVAETLRHLDAPVDDPAALQFWLAENFVRLDASITATANERRRLMLSDVDGEWCEGMYDLAKPLAQLRKKLSVEVEVDGDDIADTERDAGFIEAWAWFDDTKAKDLATAPGGRQLLGRVLLANDRCRIEAIGLTRYEELRRRFEAQCGKSVRFTGERRQNQVAQLAGRTKPADPTLVPPRLLENPQKLILASSRIAGPVPGETLEELQRRLGQEALRRFIDESIPALDGRTPREAAGDPQLRAKLVRLLKTRMRQVDEENLRSGRSDDINWLIRELGLAEIDIPAPPPRAIREEDDASEDDIDLDEADEQDGWNEGIEEGPRSRHDGLIDFPGGTGWWEKAPLPRRGPPGAKAGPGKLSGELSFEEASARIAAAMARFDTAAEALDELERSGSEVLEDLSALTAELINENEYNVLVTMLLPLWFALVPMGVPAPKLDYDQMEEVFDRELMELEAGDFAGPDEVMQFLLRGCPQTALLTHTLAQLFGTTEKMPKKMRPRREATAVLALALKTVLTELDRALRG